ncbi:hypothetical protein ACOCG7_05600 [Paraburkholderia sp. DD10]|jgi:hypothetical protein|uniref:Uncharacterized protein n=1 Tax=Paraburkholderia terricola TaxID=169427 RepID=A0A1M6XQJ5_9BURK|nr:MULTISPECIES: hypothetical protein [Paraburkholderia]SDP30691.1 hypothetical protein SAMN05192547_105832 [Paraburkholderia sediminicola]SHL08262.1 hypothetical protein SAMN05192548_105832 [Paraburkholderia terricola]
MKNTDTLVGPLLQLLETVPASVFRRSGHFAAALDAISRHREMRMFDNSVWLR